MPRGVYLLGVGLALVALALAFTDWALSLRYGVTEENFQRIREGMTLQEVESILGRAGDQLPGWAYVWEGANWRILVGVGAEGRVTGKALLPQDEAPPNLLARLRAWLGW